MPPDFSPLKAVLVLAIAAIAVACALSAYTQVRW